MKNIGLFILVFLCVQTNQIISQNITFSFSDVTTTNAGPHSSLEADVMISSDSDFKLGAGQLYFNYNTNAFGENVEANNRVFFTAPDNSYILGETAVFPIYSTFVENDNTNSRVSFSWQQALGKMCIAANNVNSTPKKLLHIRLDFIEGGSSLPSDLCFESSGSFDDQTFTACGPESGACGFADCTNSPGVQIINDTYDCSALVLPLDLLDFNASPRQDFIELNWLSQNEYDFENYELERSTNGKDFGKIIEISANGGDFQQNYFYDDEQVEKGTEYYYRLKMNDLDGSFRYSNIRTAILEKEKGSLSVYPNPTTEFLQFKTTDLEISEALIFNATGKLVRRIDVEGTNKIDVNNLTEGLYFINFFDKKGGRYLGQFVKCQK